MSFFKSVGIIVLSVFCGGAAAAQQHAWAADDGISGPLEYVPQPFDVLHYDATIDLTKAPSKEMHGTCAITIRWDSVVTALTYFRFHLRGLHIDAARYN